jgi:hypothetical protein
MSNWTLKRAKHRHRPQPERPHAETITIAPPSKPAPVKLDLYMIS